MAFKSEQDMPWSDPVYQSTPASTIVDPILLTPRDNLRLYPRDRDHVRMPRSRCEVLASLKTSRGQRMLPLDFFDNYPELKEDVRVFHRAIRYGAYRVLSVFLQGHETRLIHARGRLGNTALHVACRAGRWELIPHLLACGASRYTRNELLELPIARVPKELLKNLTFKVLLQLASTHDAFVEFFHDWMIERQLTTWHPNPFDDPVYARLTKRVEKQKSINKEDEQYSPQLEVLPGYVVRRPRPDEPCRPCRLACNLV